MTDSLTGQLLVASSLVTEPIYAGGVCLIVHHDEQNVIGVMLNRPLKPSPEALLQLLQQDSPQSSVADDDQDLEQPESEFGEGSPAAREPNLERGLSRPTPQIPAGLLENSPLGMLHFGGPISGPVVAIHQDHQQAEAMAGEGIFVAAQKHHLENLVRKQDHSIRLVVGHLGWRHEQLQHEIAAGVWHTVPATARTVFAAPNEMWPSIIRRATSNSMAKWLGIPDAIGACELN